MNRYENPASEKQDLRESLEDRSLPDKIRKIELLKQVGLPIPETAIFSRESIDDALSYIHKVFDGKGKPLIVRVACVPDQFSMPHFYIDEPEDVEVVGERLETLLKSEGTISHIIVQEGARDRRASKCELAECSAPDCESARAGFLPPLKIHLIAPGVG